MPAKLNLAPIPQVWNQERKLRALCEILRVLSGKNKPQGIQRPKVYTKKNISEFDFIVITYKRPLIQPQIIYIPPARTVIDTS
jgi:hypothetical protein